MSRRDELARRFPSLMMAWRNLWRNRLRTGLAALGIVIGVVAIAALGITGTALQYGVDEQVGDLANRVTVTAGQDADHDYLTDAQVREIRRVASNATVIPVESAEVTVSTRTAELDASVEGVTRAGELYSAQDGTVPDQLESGVLVGNSTAARLDAEVGDPVIVDGQSYRVAAVLSESTVPGQRGGGGTVVVPASALTTDGYSTVTIVAEDGDAASALANATEAAFNERRNVVSTGTQAGIQDRVGSLFDTLNTALLGVGSISLLVAGVSILNVMLMSTVERRGEIGVLRAVGVRRSEVIRMILAEASLLGALGGIVGVGLAGVVGVVLYASLYGDPTLLLQWNNVRYLVLALGFGFLASLLSGVYPAWKAANDRPVDALR